MPTEREGSVPLESKESTVTMPPQKTGPDPQLRNIRLRSSENLPAILERANCSLFFSTYEIGNVVTVGARANDLIVEFHTFERPMGMALSRDGIVIGSRNQVWFLPGVPDVGRQLEPKGKYDTAYFARKSHFTGNLLCHEIGWVGKELWVVNTRFSCLCTLHPTCHFAQRWRPPFITAVVPEDRCHLNGLAISEGQARYATALAETDSKEAWRANKATGGCLIDIPNNTVVARGFAMPHSPRLANGKLYLLHSGLGRLEVVDPASGQRDTVCELPGYTRGLAIHGSLAFVGLSKVRQSSSMDGFPIANKRDELKCGVWVVDLTRGITIGFVELYEGFTELFDVQILPGITSPHISGPMAEQYGSRIQWTISPQ
ncbi:MAG TPA: TIGR03032 family protein [Gemmata sp.]|jgi:uncharacterized protein (TIGR03032 family)|nr:TIGR03032 family protein [Gemmata sp.]